MVRTAGRRQKGEGSSRDDDCGISEFTMSRNMERKYASLAARRLETRRSWGRKWQWSECGGEYHVRSRPCTSDNITDALGLLSSQKHPLTS
ncbi:hypothetical protein IG631_05816 [Alternaria alternata]|nr:hypothetical protein IG631_05816 [Alternaria alternata]